MIVRFVVLSACSACWRSAAIEKQQALLLELSAKVVGQEALHAADILILSDEQLHLF